MAFFTLRIDFSSLLKYSITITTTFNFMCNKVNGKNIILMYHMSKP